MKFEEQFPNIKTLAKPQIDNSTTNDWGLAIAYPYTKDGEWIHKDEIQKYCLDKQRVREAIDKGCGEMGICEDCCHDGNCAFQKLKKELGLN